MGDQIRRLSDIKWHVTGVNGHTHEGASEWDYTSDNLPVEASAFETMRKRANAAEKRVAELEIMLEQVDRYAIYVADRIAMVTHGTASYMIFSAWLEEHNTR